MIAAVRASSSDVGVKLGEGGSMGQPVVHFEVQGSDREALTRFYQQLFDWKTTDVSEMNYTMVETGGDGGINGGIGTKPEGAPGGGTFYVPSDDVAGSPARGQGPGGHTTAGARGR